MIKGLEFCSSETAVKLSNLEQKLFSMSWDASIIEQKINDYKIFSNYGLILKNQGKLREAELLLKKTIELNPNWSLGHNNMGTIQKDLGKIQEAEISFRKAIKLKPDNVDDLFESILNYINLGKKLQNKINISK